MYLEGDIQQFAKYLSENTKSEGTEEVTSYETLLDKLSVPFNNIPSTPFNIDVVDAYLTLSMLEILMYEEPNEDEEEMNDRLKEAKKYLKNRPLYYEDTPILDIIWDIMNYMDHALGITTMLDDDQFLPELAKLLRLSDDEKETYCNNTDDHIEELSSELQLNEIESSAEEEEPSPSPVLIPEVIELDSDDSSDSEFVQPKRRKGKGKEKGRV